jgi:deazaflavin-dependent oxidoreductase (nitroreductase family)
MPIPDQIRYVNKRFTNRLMMLIAGRRASPIALLRHIGWKSSRSYEIPIMVAAGGGYFIFALTYGTGVDWYRNVLAAQKAELRWKAREYSLFNPRMIDAGKGRLVFGRFKGAILGILGVESYLEMDAKINSD